MSEILKTTLEKGSNYLNTIRDKYGKFNITKILDIKSPTISVKKLDFGYKISQVIEKTKTQIDYIVDRNGRVLSKNVTPGEGNPASSVIKCIKTLYSGNIVDGVSVTTPTSAYVQYKIPLFPGFKGFQKNFSKTSDGWILKGSTPLNL